MAAGLWWLNRPLFDHCPSPVALEDFLRDLVSERSPWPIMEVYLQKRHLLTYRRQRGCSGMFDLSLEAADESMEPVAIGPTSLANLDRAADSGRSALRNLGVAQDAPLKIRYGGSMDSVVVARTRGAHTSPAG